MTRTLGVLLAAGASRRFGAQDKLLAMLHGTPLILHAARTLMAADCSETVVVVSSEAVAALLPAGMRSIRVAPDQPMSMSFRAAVAHAQQCGAGRALICLGDMPRVRPATLAALLARPQGSAACRLGTVRMPPVLLDARDYEAGLQAQGDAGARGVIAGLQPEALIELDAGEASDVDTPEQLARLR
ncbi:nucleotidyltransferase family protein [Paenirhodobacter populi]|nr:nucleotidyltransferase family protein [Sinirhodobacter populi]